MKHLIFIIICFLSLLAPNTIEAQVPYFSGTVGNNKLYGYTSLKVRPGINSQETYTTFQYGTSTHTATGIDIYTSNGNAYMGYLFRAGFKFNKWIGIGAQITPSFDLADNYKFSYLTSALYLNGAITRDNKLFWCSNTWWGVNRGSKNTIFNWEYLGCSLPLKNGQTITPMAGVIHSWRFDQDADLSIGCYYTVNAWNVYLWGNDFFQSHPRIVVSVSFVF